MLELKIFVRTTCRIMNIQKRMVVKLRKWHVVASSLLSVQAPISTGMLTVKDSLPIRPFGFVAAQVICKQISKCIMKIIAKNVCKTMKLGSCQ